MARRPECAGAVSRAVRQARVVRDACVAAAIEGYESAQVAGLCHAGAWVAAVEAMRRLAPERLADLPAGTDDNSGQS